MKWTTPAQLKAQVQRRWDRGDILAARISGEKLFPLKLKLAKPGARDVTQHFDDVRRWTQALADESHERRGFGYVIEWQETRHRVHGRNTLPQAVVVPSEDDALRLTGSGREAARFAEIAETTLARFPALREWLTRRPLIALEHAEDWARILTVLDYFRAHPRPGLYLRQLDIRDVDTKFVEGRKGLLAELLDLVLPETAVDRETSGARNFEKRYGFRMEAPLIRFRILAPALYIQGLADLSMPPEQFARLTWPVRCVFITENKVNGLAFPDVPGAIVLFGLGYGLERLSEIGWLRETPVWYWGDIDTHGFAILDRLRASLPHAQSFLMDRETLMAHRALWGQETANGRFNGELERLTAPEQALFEDLKLNRMGDRIRLEQERIGYGWLRRSI